MRAGLLVTIVAVVVLGGASAGSASVFPDLPGMKAVEKVTAGKGPLGSTSTSTGTSSSPAKTDRVPAPDSKNVVQSAVPSNQLATITDLPGGHGLPLIGDAASKHSAFPIGLAMIALLFTVLYARFLYRLNSL